MKVNFEKVIIPCVVNDVTLWHLEHGFLWDVVEAPSGRKLGVFFASLLCGDGSVIHFYSVPGVKISPATVLGAFRKAIRMMSTYGSVIYATVPKNKHSLIRCLVRLGFVIVTEGGFFSDHQEIILLKYLNAPNAILKTSSQTDE